MDKHEDTALPLDAAERAAVEQDAARLDALPAAKRAEIIRFFDEARVAMTAQAERKRGAALATAASVSAAERVRAGERALSDQGLAPLQDQSARGNVIGDCYDQDPVRINTKAHPMALATIALSRAERCDAFADLLSRQSDETSVYELAQMINELVQVVRVLVEHPGICGAEWPAAEPDEVQP